MKISQSLFWKRAILVMAPFVFIACEEPNKQLGFEQVIGEVPAVADTTLDVITYSRNVDSILVAFDYSTQLSLGGYAGNRLVGNMTGGYFGQAQAAIVSQLFLTETSPDFGPNPVVDSVKLYLRYSGSYGDTSKPMSVEVLSLSESLDDSSRYYSSYEPQIEQKIGEKLNFYPEPESLTRIGDVTTLATLSIPMDRDYFQQKFADVADGNNPDFADNQSFKEYFKGITVRATNEDGAILYFDLTAINSRMVVYYQNDDEDSLRLDLDFEQMGQEVPINFSIYDQDYSGAFPVGFDLDNMNTTEGEELVFVEAMGGVAGVFEIPGLAGLTNSGVMINRATLEVKKATGTGMALAPPNALIFMEFEGGGLGDPIADFLPTNGTVGGGVFRSEPFYQGFYRFDLTRYVFDVANGGENIKLALVPNRRSTAANRVILQGTKSDNPVKLKIYYTKNP